MNGDQKTLSKQCFWLPFVASRATNGNQKFLFLTIFVVICSSQFYLFQQFFVYKYLWNPYLHLCDRGKIGLIALH